jgi:hypothetical protein
MVRCHEIKRHVSDKVGWIAATRELVIGDSSGTGENHAHELNAVARAQPRGKLEASSRGGIKSLREQVQGAYLNRKGHKWVVTKHTKPASQPANPPVPTRYQQQQLQQPEHTCSAVVNTTMTAATGPSQRWSRPTSDGSRE